MSDSIDHRLEQLVERHEALTQTVGIIAGMQLQNEKHLQDVRIAIQQDAENIRALARIAEIHERRLSHLEGDTE